MPRSATKEVRIKCRNCNEYTESLPEIIIHKNSENRYLATTYCKICNKPKSKFLNMTQITYLPDNIKSASPNTTITLGEKYGTSIVSLLPLLSGIANLIPKPAIFNNLPTSIQPSVGSGINTDIEDPEIIDAIKILDNDLVKRGGAIPWGMVASAAPLIIQGLTSLGSFLIDKFKGNGFEDGSGNADVIKSLILLNDKIKNDKTGNGFGDIMKLIMKYGPGIVSAISDIGSKIIGFFRKKPDTELKQAKESPLQSAEDFDDDKYEDAKGEGLHNQDLIDRCIEYLQNNGLRVTLP